MNQTHKTTRPILLGDSFFYFGNESFDINSLVKLFLICLKQIYLEQCIFTSQLVSVWKEKWIFSSSFTYNPCFLVELVLGSLFKEFDYLMSRSPQYNHIGFVVLFKLLEHINQFYKVDKQNNFYVSASCRFQKICCNLIILFMIVENLWCLLVWVFPVWKKIVLHTASRLSRSKPSLSQYLQILCHVLSAMIYECMFIGVTCIISSIHIRFYVFYVKYSILCIDVRQYV